MFAERSGRLRFLREEVIVVSAVYNTSGRGSLCQVHQVQTVVGLEPEIRDEQFGWMGEEPGPSGSKLGTCDDLSHQA